MFVHVPLSYFSQHLVEVPLHLTNTNTTRVQKLYQMDYLGSYGGISYLDSLMPAGSAFSGMSTPTPTTGPLTTPVKPATPVSSIQDVRKPRKDVPGYVPSVSHGIELSMLILDTSYRGFIQIVVGEGDTQTSFDVHKYLVTERSPFFKNAMSGDWKEAKDRVVNFPEDDPATLQSDVHLLYTNQLAVIPSPLPVKYDGSEETEALAKLYALAEKLQDVDTKNIVLKAMLLSSLQIRSITASCVVPGLPTVRIIYAGTPEGSPIRRLLVDIYTYRGRSAWLKGDSPSDCKDFGRSQR